MILIGLETVVWPRSILDFTPGTSMSLRINKNMCTVFVINLTLFFDKMIFDVNYKHPDWILIDEN